MNNLFSNIFKKREKVIIPLQEEIENLEFLLRIKENNSNIRDEKEYIDLLKRLYNNISTFENFFNNEIFININNLTETLKILDLDSLKEKIIKENLIRDKVLNEFRVNRKLISSTLLNELDLDFGNRVRGILGLNFYKKNTEEILTKDLNRESGNIYNLFPNLTSIRLLKEQYFSEDKEKYWETINKLNQYENTTK